MNSFMKNFIAPLLLLLSNFAGLQRSAAQIIWDSTFNGSGMTTRLYYAGSPSVLPIGLNAKMHLVTSTGKIVTAATVDGYYSGYGYGYLPNGTANPSFGVAGVLNIPAANDNMRMTATVGDTIFVLGKDIDLSSGIEYISVTKMDTSGNLASDFGTGGQIHFPILLGGYNYGCTPSAIAVQADGKIVVAAKCQYYFRYRRNTPVPAQWGG
jgi:hypothetical protein